MYQPHRIDNFLQPLRAPLVHYHYHPWLQVLHALIKQRQRDVERGRDAAERMARLAHDLKVSNHQRDKLAQRFTAKERELGALENRVSPLGSIVPDTHQEKVHLLV